MRASSKASMPRAREAETRIPSILIEAFENANSAFAIFSDDGLCIHANALMPGVTALIGRGINTLTDLAPSETTSADAVRFERFRAGKLKSYRARHAFLRKHDHPYWFDVSLKRMSAADGEASFIIAHLVDINAEIVGARKEALWAATLGAARQGVWDHDARLGTVTYSPTWYHIRGMDESELADSSREAWLTRLHPDDRNRIESTVDKQEAGEDGYDVLEYRERHKDGHFIWILSRGKPIEWDEDGHPVRTVGTDTDITELKAMEAELALEKERLHVILQSIADGVISVDRKGKVTFLNKTAERLTGWTMEEAMAQPVSAVFDSRLEAAPEESSDLVPQCLETGLVFHASDYTLLNCRDGQSRYVREIASPVLDDKGRVNGAVLVFRDATKRRQLVRELEYTATHDSLTGLDNRAAFEQQLQACVATAREGHEYHALCLIDLDHFKTVNDSAGHAAGDALLKAIADVIRESCRSSDCVARIGGDEFGVLLKNSTLKSSRETAQRISDRIANLAFEWQDEAFTTGASIGVASIDSSARSAGELYRNADSACYSAKRNGRGCVVVYG